MLSLAERFLRDCAAQANFDGPAVLLLSGGRQLPPSLGHLNLSSLVPVRPEPFAGTLRDGAGRIEVVAGAGSSAPVLRPLPAFEPLPVLYHVRRRT